jgi:hypothetical protein
MGREKKKKYLSRFFTDMSCGKFCFRLLYNFLLSSPVLYISTYSQSVPFRVFPTSGLADQTIFRCARRLVNYVDIQSAIRKLKIKAFKKSWRDRTSEYGLICKSTGRKNTKGNRLRIRAYIENRRRPAKYVLSLNI